MSFWSRHKIFETNSIILLIGVLLVISVGGLVEIAPLFYLKNTIEKVQGMRPYTPLELAGRSIYVREGCYNCHSQMVRPLRDEIERTMALLGVSSLEELEPRHVTQLTRLTPIARDAAERAGL